MKNNYNSILIKETRGKKLFIFLKIFLFNQRQYVPLTAT
jgi:hypothetical protein